MTESGLEEIDATGQTFDPNLHEAVSQQESADVPEGHVLQQLRKGYKLRDRLLRPATVVVAKKPASVNRFDHWAARATGAAANQCTDLTHLTI